MMTKEVCLSIRLLLIWTLVAALAQQAYATTVTIHTEDARATLLALQNPTLNHEDAMKIAQMHGNQAVLQKLHEFKITSTTEDFANALYATAHGQPITKENEKDTLFEIEEPKIPQHLALLQEIDASPKAFQQRSEQRISLFVPPNSDIHLEGYLVAAGDGGGYAFGGTEFFLNIGIVDDIVVAQETTTHELYHAVQGAFAADRELKIDNPQGHAQQACIRPASGPSQLAGVYVVHDPPARQGSPSANIKGEYYAEDYARTEQDNRP
jgi:hypothetical protein